MADTPVSPEMMHPSHDSWVRDPRTGDGECSNCGACTDCDGPDLCLAPCKSL